MKLVQIIEGLVLSRWNDFLQDVEEKTVELTFRDILFFVSGVREVPPGGIELHIGFLHAPEQCGEKSKFPKANACSCQLLLPVVHGTYDDFKKDVTFAFTIPGDMDMHNVLKLFPSLLK